MTTQKKKHIQLSNILLERRYLNESTLGDTASDYGWKVNDIGYIDNEIENVVSTLIISASTSTGKCKGTVAAGKSPIYSSTPESKHNRGYAVDVFLGDTNCTNIFLTNAQNYSKTYPKLFVELVSPSKFSKSGHIHLSYDVNSPEKKSSDESKMVSTGKVDLDIDSKEEPGQAALMKLLKPIWGSK